jgi:DNA-directed RNA polymerase specialized sigma subunit
MKRLTEIITEAKNTRLSASALKALKTEIDNFINKMDNKISSEVKTVTVLLQKYNIYDKEVIGRLIKGTKTEIKSIVTEFGIEERDINEMLSILKKLNTENRTRLIPIMMTKNEREDYMRGEKKDDDITLDLETERGKNKVAKEYMPMVNKIAKMFVGKSAFTFSDLVSSGTEGLYNAMLNYRKPETNDAESLDISDDERKALLDAKRKKFEQYAKYRIIYQIKHDINYLSHTVTMGQYEYRKKHRNGESTHITQSIDQTFGDGENQIDRMLSLAEQPDAFKGGDIDDTIKLITKRLEEEFPMKKCEIFYRLFGVNGRQRVKARTIADELGVDETQIARTKRQMVTFLQTDKKLLRALSELSDLYTESLLCDMYNLGRETILERLIADDTYVLLEDILKFENKNVFKRAMSNALSEIDTDGADFIVMCIKNGFDFIDRAWNVPSSRGYIIQFLSRLEPTVNYAARTDAFYLGKMSEILELCQKHKLYV